MPHSNRSTRVLSSFAAVLAIAGWASLCHADTAQVAEGAKLFASHCAKCHGKAGEGTKKAPPLVGKDAFPLDPRPGAKVRKTQFHTAEDVAEFASTKMPANKPGSLKPEEYYAILAFDLDANGIAEAKTKKIDATTLSEIKLH